MARKPFYLVIADGDKKIFTVEGPMLDGAVFNNLINKKQDEGRKISCFTSAKDTKEEAIKNTASSAGFKDFKYVPYSLV